YVGSAAAVKEIPIHRRHLPADDVSMRIDFLAQDLQLDRAGRNRRNERLFDAQLEAGRLPDLLETDAGMQTENFHSLRLVVITQNGEIGDNAVRSGAGRQAGGLAGAGAR